MAEPSKGLTLEQRIMRLVAVTNSGCWQWTGAINRHGYGKLTVNAKTAQAHRVSYELFRGAIPNGLSIDHLCRNRACANPAHMEPVETRTNTLRGISHVAARAIQTHCKHGHEFTAENTYLWRTSRICKACAKERKTTHKFRGTK